MKNILIGALAIYFILTPSVYAEESLNKIQNDIIHLQSSIVDSEKQIRAKSLEYKTVMSELNIYDDKLKIIQHTLFEYKQKVKLDYLKIQKSWNLLLMQQADSNRHNEYLLTHRQIMNDMKLKVTRLKNNIAWATKLEGDLSVSMKSSAQIKMKADLLLSLIQHLEDNKIDLIGKIHQKKNSEADTETKNINTVLEHKIADGDFLISKNFTLPINKFNKFERSEHGINFYFRADALLLAPANGKVIYVGELSSYGNVIMIEHDQKIISVLLGEIQAEVDETSVVTQGSIIGKLAADRDGGTKSLYYEIRKEERPVPALSYLKIKN